MAAGAFQFIGGAADNILFKLTTTAATQIAGDANYSMFVPWFLVTEITGATPAVTVDINDGTTTFIIRPTVNITAKGQILYDQGYWLNPGQFLRVTAGAANQIDVVGVRSLPNTQGAAGNS